MSVIAKGPPYVIGGEDWSQMKEWKANDRAASKVPGACDSTAFGQAGRFEEPPVHKPAIPEMDERNRFFKKLLDDVPVKEGPYISTTQVGGTHYSELAIQPWDAMRAWMSPEEYIGYHVGTVIGYLSRHKAKGSEQDLQKAGHHMDELRRYLKEDEEYPW